MSVMSHDINIKIEQMACRLPKFTGCLSKDDILSWFPEQLHDARQLAAIEILAEAIIHEHRTRPLKAAVMTIAEECERLKTSAGSFTTPLVITSAGISIALAVNAACFPRRLPVQLDIVHAIKEIFKTKNIELMSRAITTLGKCVKRGEETLSLEFFIWLGREPKRMRYVSIINKWIEITKMLEPFSASIVDTMLVFMSNVKQCRLTSRILTVFSNTPKLNTILTKDHRGSLSAYLKENVAFSGWNKAKVCLAVRLWHSGCIDSLFAAASKSTSCCDAIREALAKHRNEIPMKHYIRVLNNLKGPARIGLNIILRQQRGGTSMHQSSPRDLLGPSEIQFLSHRQHTYLYSTVMVLLKSTCDSSCQAAESGTSQGQTCS